jgi:hypothetical protein
MTAINFKEANTVYAKNQPQYKQLPAFKSDDTIATNFTYG